MPSQQLLVSVIIPAYQARNTIGATLSGALTQTYPHVEIVVVDDGSTDGTAAVAESYGDAVRVLRQPNAGSAAARNTALAASGGDLVALCDADDVLLPGYIQAAVDAYQQAGGGRRIVACESTRLTSRGIAHGSTLIGRHFASRGQRMAILQRNFVPILSVFPRALVEDIGGFAENLRYAEDWHLWIRAVLAGWEVVVQPAPQALYRITSGSKSAEGLLVSTPEDDVLRLIQQEQAHLLSARELSFLERRLNSSAPRVLDQWGAQALKERRFADSRRIYRELARLTSSDPMVRTRALAIGYLPGVHRVARWRQLRIEERVGDLTAGNDGVDMAA